ncbi:MAG: radical SAM protein [Methanosarcinales archaeon]|nr:radical SAM protein [Methanosarcinales archaeon]
MNEILFNIAAINICTEAEGPYKRAAIWFQGCTIGCAGCCNPHFQSLEPEHIMTHDELIAVIHQSFIENNIEGVTYLGGEPTLQRNLVFLSESVHKMGLGVILFTGNTFSNLDPAFLKDVDMAIDGKYEQDLTDNRNLIGSSNQNIIFITDRYRSQTEWFLNPRGKRAEINISGNDIVFSGDVL